MRSKVVFNDKINKNKQLTKHCFQIFKSKHRRSMRAYDTKLKFAEMNMKHIQPKTDTIRTFIEK